MLQVNLRTQVKVVFPNAGSSIGRYVANGREMVRQRLLVQSLESVRKYLQENIPDLCKSNLAAPLKRSHEKSMRAQLRELTQIGAVNSFRDFPWEGIRAKLEILNSLVRDKKVDERYLEFVLADLPGLPAALVRIVSRAKPIDQEAESYLSGAGALGVYISLIMKLERKFYTKSELFHIIEREIGAVSRNAADGFLLSPICYHLFQRFMRPQRLQEAEPLYHVWGTGFNPLANKEIALVILPGSNNSSVILRAEAAEMEKEGRIVPVLYGKKLPIYFIPEALKEWMELGRVMEVTKEGKKQYIESATIGHYIKEVSEIPPTSVPAAKVFLNYKKEGKLSDSERRSYPLLATAIEILEGSPQGSDQYFEAANIAAQNNASELDMAASLLLKEICQKSQKERDSFEEIFKNHFMKRYLELDGSLLHYYELTNELKYRIEQLEKLLTMDISKEPINNADDVRAFIKSFLYRFNKPEIRIGFLAAVLGKLRHTPVGGLKKGEIKNLLVVITPLAEKFELKELAADIRNEIFRIAFNRQYSRVKKSIESVMGMTYPEMALHLENTAQLLREIMIAAGFRPEEFEIICRVKHPYSAWEKMQSYGLEQPGYVYDILGATGLVLTRRAAYRMLDLAEQVFPELSARNFDDRYGLVKFMRRAGIPSYVDRLAKPKPSGFAAVTTRRLTLLKLPIELQFTTFENHRFNKEGKAAHWHYKMAREIKAFYSLEIGDLSNL